MGRARNEARFLICPKDTSHGTDEQGRFKLIWPPVTGCAQMTEQELARRIGPNTPYHEQGNFCRYKDLAFSPSGQRVDVDWYWPDSRPGRHQCAW